MNSDNVKELNDIASRQRNFLIMDFADSKDAHLTDLEKIKSIFESCSVNCPITINRIKVFRCGRSYIGGKTRPLNVILKCEDEVHWVYANKKHLGNGKLQIRNDMTKLQMIHFKKVKAEFTKRKEEGEENILIRYIKGTPTIIKKSVTKNLHFTA